MAYNQNKNPFQSKSPLNHNLRDKRTGTNFTHFHDPNNQSNIYSSDQKVISGSNKFGTQSGRVKDDITGKRRSEEDYAREYARQISGAYNSGQLAEGQFLADDLYKRNRKLSLKNGNLKLKPKYKGIDEGSMFNTRKALANEDGGYTIPETQYTEDQIYDMMVQGGGLVSIVDGKIVSGNPNQAMSEGYDQANKIRYNNDDFRNQYEEGTEEEFNIRAERNNRPESTQQQRDELQEKKNAILARREQEKANQMQLKADKKLAAQEKINAILAAREQKKLDLQNRKAEILARIKAKNDSPVNNNSPLHQEQETDPRTGQQKENYVYDEGVEEVGETIEETIYNEDGSIKGTSFRTPTTTTFTGTETIENVEETPGSTTNPTPPSWDDCYKNGVFQTGAVVGEGVNRILCEQKPPSNDVITTPPGVIEEDITNTDTYSTVNYDERFEPVVPEPIPESASDLFNLSGGEIRGGGMKIDWDLRLPQAGPKFTEWVKNLTKSGKKCGNCDYLNR